MLFKLFNAVGLKEKIFPAKPEKGEFWICKPIRNDDPFPSRYPSSSVLILDVKQGWVRYKMSDFWNDERQKIKDFMKFYEKTTQNPPFL